MRIALLTYSTRPRGGVVHTLSLAEALAELGHDVDVWSLARGGDAGFFRPVEKSVGVHLVPFPDVPGEQVGRRIVRSIEALRDAFGFAAGVGSSGSGGSIGSSGSAGYDIVHAQDCISANAVPRCVRTVHHLDTFTTPELAACHERAIVDPFAHVCVSAAVAGELRDGWGIEATVIPNGVDAARFEAAASSPQRADWATRLGRYVLAVGGIEPRKGTDDLVQAMALVQRRDPSLRLVIAGGETLFDYRNYRARVLASVDQLGVNVEMLGPVEHDALPALVAECSAFAFPSTKEGFGLAAMEALATGVPVVVRDLPVLHEVFGNAVDYAATPADLAATLLGAIRRADLVRSVTGQRLAAGHTWSAAARAHTSFYRSVLDPQRRYGELMLGESEFYAGIAVDDIEAAHHFYAETLGLEVEAPDNAWLRHVHGPGTRSVLLYQRPGPHTPPEYTVLNFPVTDIEAEVDALIAAGVVFEQYADGPVATNSKGIAHPGPWQAWFRDPAGNILSVLQ